MKPGRIALTRIWCLESSAAASFEKCATAFFATEYVIGAYPAHTAEMDDETLLYTVRMRFRPWAKGPLSPEDVTPLT